MIFQKRTRKKLFILFSFFACLAALYHFVGIFYQFDKSPPWRHAIFVAINLICIYGFIKRPKYFFYFLLALLIQQCYSHGTYLWNMWMEQKKIHWLSVIDIVVLIAGFICLYEDKREQFI